MYWPYEEQVYTAEFRQRVTEAFPEGTPGSEAITRMLEENSRALRLVLRDQIETVDKDSSRHSLLVELAAEAERIDAKWDVEDRQKARDADDGVVY